MDTKIIVSDGQNFHDFSARQKALVTKTFEFCPWASHSFIFGHFLPDGLCPVQSVGS